MAVFMQLCCLFLVLLPVCSYMNARLGRLARRPGHRSAMSGVGIGRKPSGTLRDVPLHILRPDYAIDGTPKGCENALPWQIDPCASEDIPRMRTAGRLAREVLDTAVRSVAIGMTTDYIDSIVHAACMARSCYPSPLNYQRFPKSCCTSVNEVICHGIPGSRVLKDGDIVNIDVTIFHDGVHGDCSETVCVGNVAPRTRDLVQTTHAALQNAISHCRAGLSYNTIGGRIEDITNPKGFSSVQEFAGHGIHRHFHCNPDVLHFRNTLRSGTMEVGHTFTIEPMVCLGKRHYEMLADGWTAVTKDRLPSAQFEHTLLVTADGVDVLTKKLDDSPKFFWET